VTVVSHETSRRDGKLILEDSLCGPLQAETGSYSQDVRIGTAVQRFGDICLGFVDVSEQKVSRSVRSEDGGCTSSWKLVKLFVEVVRLM
jgi:hypothetical protein